MVPSQGRLSGERGVKEEPMRKLGIIVRHNQGMFKDTDSADSASCTAMRSGAGYNPLLAFSYYRSGYICLGGWRKKDKK
jgi:hypothetical protein